MAEREEAGFDRRRPGRQVQYDEGHRGKVRQHADRMADVVSSRLIA
jgi:hypothetical protein